jgi:NOL1/NOP2/fmu family ribosome biogenesis protein
MFRKDEGAIAGWSVDNVKLCKERQQRILSGIWPSLKEGGALIYSTCSYNLEENEENVQWIRDELEAEILPVKTEEKWNIASSMTENVAAYRFFPHRTKGEGFFCAVLRKKGEIYGSKKIKGKGSNKTSLPAGYQNYISGKENFMFYPDKSNWHAFPCKHYDDLQTIKSHLTTISEGICLGEFKGKDFIPHQSLALSIHFNKDAFTPCQVNRKTAIAYLRKEPVILPDMPKGYILLTYRSKPLGFVKNIGNRANNLYPQEWRIRSANIPCQFDDCIIGS